MNFPVAVGYAERMQAQQLYEAGEAPELHIRLVGHMVVSAGGLYMVPYMNTVAPQSLIAENFDNKRRGIQLAHDALKNEFELRQETATNIPGHTQYELFSN